MRAELLFDQARKGDERAFVALLDLFEQPVFSYFRRRGVQSADAEDLTQQVFVVILERADRFDERRGSLRSFLFGIARRTWLKHVASIGRWPGELPSEFVDDSQQQPDAEVDIRKQQTCLTAAIARLPQVAREVLLLRVHHRLSLQEIGAALGMPVNTVKSHLFRARNRLRELVGST